MSHFSYIKTRILSLDYLQKALEQLSIEYDTFESALQNSDNQSSLKIRQKNGYDIDFNWNGTEYELVTDLSFWEQKWSLTTFVGKISQAYANETIINESNKQGFEFIKKTENRDGSVTVVLERWK